MKFAKMDWKQKKAVYEVSIKKTFARAGNSEFELPTHPSLLTEYSIATPGRLPYFGWISIKSIHQSLLTSFLLKPGSFSSSSIQGCSEVIHSASEFILRWCHSINANTNWHKLHALKLPVRSVASFTAPHLPCVRGQSDLHRIFLFCFALGINIRRWFNSCC